MAVNANARSRGWFIVRPSMRPPLFISPRLGAGVLMGCLVAAGETHTEIDRLIAAGAEGPMAPLADDAEFLRRVSLDLAGCIPTADEARRFLASTAPEKRAGLINELLASARWAQRMEQAITVMLLERRTGGKIPDEKWSAWLREQFTKNRPWHEMVRELLRIDGDPKENPAAKLLANEEKFDADVVTQTIGRLFLGMDLKCVQCHDHPSVERFKQADYFGIHAFLSATKLETDKETKQPRMADAALAERVEFKSVFHPDAEFTAPHLPGVQPVAFTPDAKPLARAKLAEELPSPTNERFVQNAVNRFWFLLMGRGLVHPLDRLHAGNPPSHPELMELLCREFVAHGFDVKWLLREIALSSAYQRSSRAPDGVKLEDIPPESYRVANMKPLSAEQVALSLMRATGALEKMETVKDASFSARSYITGTAKNPLTSAASALTVFASIFGNPAGEPEVEFAPGMAHTLFLMNDRMMLDWLKPSDGSLVARLTKLETLTVAEELYLSVLTRLPGESEMREVAEYLTTHSARRDAALGELAWALLASAEFRLNH